MVRAAALLACLSVSPTSCYCALLGFRVEVPFCSFHNYIECCNKLSYLSYRCYTPTQTLSRLLTKRVAECAYIRIAREASFEAAEILRLPSVAVVLVLCSQFFLLLFGQLALLVHPFTELLSTLRLCSKTTVLM